MKNLVVYSSRNGNTKLIADEIAEELSGQIVNLDEVEPGAIDLNGVSTIFLGSGIYGGKFSPGVLKFAESLDRHGFTKESPLSLVFFVTWLGRGKSDSSAVNHCKKLMHSEWINFREEHYSCLGESFKLIRRGHPDENDITNARAWARKIVS